MIRMIFLMNAKERKIKLDEISYLPSLFIFLWKEGMEWFKDKQNPQEDWGRRI